MRWITFVTCMMERVPDEGDDPHRKNLPPSDDAELDKKIPAKKAAAKRPKRTRRPPAIPWKKPKDMPKRPLSAYNLFFQHERQRILSEAQEKYPDVEESKNEPGSAGSQDVGEGDVSMATEQQESDSSRKHLKTSGIGFAKLGKAIGAKWKDLDPTIKAPFEAQAAKEKERYDREIAEWRAQKKLEKTAAESEESPGQAASRQTFALPSGYPDMSQYSTQGTQHDPFPSSWFQISPSHHAPASAQHMDYTRSHQTTLREASDEHHRLQQIPVAAPMPLFRTPYRQRRQSLPEATMHFPMSSDDDEASHHHHQHHHHIRRFSAPYLSTGQFTRESFYGDRSTASHDAAMMMDPTSHEARSLSMEEPLIQPHPDAVADFSVLYPTPSTSETDKSSPGDAQETGTGDGRTQDPTTASQQAAASQPSTTRRRRSSTVQPSIVALSSKLDQEEVDFLINLPFDEDSP